jgi:dephospho-CoA kinase
MKTQTINGVIGVIGQNGTGKDEGLKYLRAKHGVLFLSTGDAVREIAAREGLKPTRKNLGRSRRDIVSSLEKVVL